MITVPSARYDSSEYTATSARPMRPAIRPIWSCWVPRVAEIVSELCTSKLSGRAPNLSWSARVVALSCVKLPEMLGRPSRMTPIMRGALMTSPSSTKANWSRGDSPSMRFWFSRVLT